MKRRAGTGTWSGAWVVALAVVLSTVPAAASPDREVSVVAGQSITSSLRAGTAGVERTATLPGLAALQLATTPQDVRDAFAAHLRGLQRGAAAAAATSRFEDVFPVGDLDGDRRRDVIVASGADAGVTYAGIQGTSGKQLWAVTVPAGADHFSWALPLRGPGSKGVLLVTESFEEVPSDAAWSLRVTTTVTAVSDEGVSRWSRTAHGVVSFSDAGIVLANLMYPVGYGLLNGPGDDIAIRTDNTVYSFAAGGTSRLEIVDGGTGRTGAVVEAASEADVPAAGVVGDLDGDALLDVVTASSSGGQVLTVAHSGVDGRPLWHATHAGLPVYWVGSAGRLDGDAVADLLLVGIDWEGHHFFALTVASGADGALMWQRSSDGLQATTDTDGDGRGEVLLVHVLFDRLAGVRYTLVTATGKVLYRRTYGVKPPRGSFLIMITLSDMGDIDGDSNLDMAHDVAAFGFDDASSANERGVVLARNGRKAHDGPLLQTLYASLDGRGHDMVTVRRADGGMRVIARDGRTAKELWRRKLAAAGFRWGYPLGADLTGDGRAEVLILVSKKGGSALTVIDGRSRAVRWRR